MSIRHTKLTQHQYAWGPQALPKYGAQPENVKPSVTPHQQPFVKGSTMKGWFRGGTVRFNVMRSLETIADGVGERAS
jgi:hypothetical protein